MSVESCVCSDLLVACGAIILLLILLISWQTFIIIVPVLAMAYIMFKTDVPIAIQDMFAGFELWQVVVFALTIYAIGLFIAYKWNDNYALGRFKATLLVITIGFLLLFPVFIIYSVCDTFICAGLLMVMSVFIIILILFNQ